MPAQVEHAALARIDDEFLALILADHDLLRAEFDAIVGAARTGRRPGRTPSIRSRPAPPVIPPARSAAPPGTSSDRGAPGVTGWIRARPPPPDPTTPNAQGQKKR